MLAYPPGQVVEIVIDEVTLQCRGDGSVQHDVFVHPSLFYPALASPPYPQHHRGVKEAVQDRPAQKHDLAAQIQRVHPGLRVCEPFP